MAIVKQSDIAAQGNSEVKLNNQMALPKNVYIIRCKKEEAKIAKSSGNYMYERNWEIASPDTIQIGNDTVKIGGTALKVQYLTITCVDDKDGKSAAERTLASQKRLFAENAKLGLAQEIDTENAALECEGIYAEAILGTDKYEERMEPTAEQKAKGQPGDIIKEDGKPIVRYQPTIIEIRRKCSAPGGL